MATTFWLIALTIAIVGHGFIISSLMDEIEAIKSWKPFVDICKIKIPEEDNEKRRKKKSMGKV